MKNAPEWIAEFALGGVDPRIIKAIQADAFAHIATLVAPNENCEVLLAKILEEIRKLRS